MSEVNSDKAFSLAELTCTYFPAWQPTECASVVTNVASAWAVWLGGFAVLVSWALWKLLVRRRKVFVAVPMAALDTEEKFNSLKLTVMDIIAALEALPQWPRLKVYSAIRHVSWAQWERGAVPSIDVLRQIRRSSFFVAILPARVYTSVLLEIGYALALNRPFLRRKTKCLVWYRVVDEEKSTLPYTLENLSENAPERLYLTKTRYSDEREIVDAAKTQGARFLDPNAPKT